MSKDEALRRLAELQGGDPEQAHIDANEVLLALIADDEVRSAYYAIEKWYA